MNKFRPYATYVVIAVCVLIYLLMYVMGVADTTNGIVLFGGYYKPFIMTGEVWRFLTAGFVHCSFLHLFMNMSAMSSLGPIMELYLGRVKMVILLCVGVIFGCLFTYVLSGNVVSAGLSGGLYALMSAFFSFMISMGAWKSPNYRNMMIRNLSLNLLINLLPGVSWTGHLGGAVAGLLLMPVLINLDKNKEKKKHYIVAFVIMCASLIVFAWNNSTIRKNEIYAGLDLQVLSTEKKFLPDTYIRYKCDKLDQIYGYAYDTQLYKVLKELEYEEN